MNWRALPILMAAAAPVWAQGTASSPAFEVASLKISPDHGSAITAMSPYGSERFTITNAPADLLLQVAFGVLPHQIVGEPGWFDSERYDLTAKAEEGVLLTSRELQSRLQRLLAERMKLEVHRETKQFAGFALLVAKGGAKLKKSAGETTEQGMVYPGGMRLPHATLDWLAAMLITPAGRPVVNQTGIAGSYDIELSYAKEGDMNSAQPSVFTALEERLGLRLEAQKVSVAMLVLDHIDRVPTDN